MLNKIHQLYPSAQRKKTLQTVLLKDILKDEVLQVRACMQQSVVAKYAEAMATGAEFPPIVLAYINGSLVLVDGWHRMEAATILGNHKIDAYISNMTFEEARWEAAKANTEHGLPLTKREHREVFRAFIEAGMYRKGHKWLSYRDIGRQVGKGFSTIRNWMKADYPRLFKRYQQNANTLPETEATEVEKRLMQQRLKQAQAAMENTRNLGRTLDSATLGTLIATLEETLRELRQRPYEPVKVLQEFEF